jgi:hypothetical protein
VIREQVRKVGLISGWKVNSGRWMCPWSRARRAF